MPRRWFGARPAARSATGATRWYPQLATVWRDLSPGSRRRGSRGRRPRL